MFELITLKEDSFGLDINDLSLKIIKIRKTSRGAFLDSFADMPLEAGIVEDGIIQREDDLAAAIKKICGDVKGKKLKTRYVACSLPEEKAFLEIMPMPVAMKENEIRSAAALQVENYIPLSVNEVYLGFAITNKDDKKATHLDALVAAMPKKIVNTYVNVLKKAGLIPVVMTMESQAIVKSIVKNDSKKSTVAAVDIGRDKTIFIVSVNNSVRFTSLLSFSSRNSTKEAPESQDKSPKLSSSKTKEGKKNVSESDGAARTANPPPENLAAEIQKYISFYEEHNISEHAESRKIEKIILCGGGAVATGLQEFLRGRLNIPVEKGNPWINLQTQISKEGTQEPTKWLPFTTAIGLAMPEN